MQRFGTLALALTCLSVGPLQTLPVQAETLPAISETTRAAAAAFESLRQTSNALRVRSPQEIYGDFAAMEGKIVELQGEVAGSLARENKRTVLLRMNEEMAVLEIGPDLTDFSNLRTGSVVSLLARVDKKEIGNPVRLTIVAASTRVEAPRPASTLPSAPVAMDNSVIIVPPMTSTNLQQPQLGQNPAPAAARPAPSRAVPSNLASRSASARTWMLGSNPNESIESQKPAYAALVHRYNKKLNAAQVDEIATALLAAAFANRMDPRFLAAIIAVESDFDIYCLSSSGAMGLGQLMPFNVPEAKIRDPWNPTQNVHGTARLLRGHLNDFANRKDGTLLAVAAYNAGPNAVKRAGYRVPNGKQVQRYVWKVYHRYKEFAPDRF